MLSWTVTLVWEESGGQFGFGCLVALRSAPVAGRQREFELEDSAYWMMALAEFTDEMWWPVLVHAAVRAGRDVAGLAVAVAVRPVTLCVSLLFSVVTPARGWGENFDGVLGWVRCSLCLLLVAVGVLEAEAVGARLLALARLVPPMIQCLYLAYLSATAR